MDSVLFKIAHQKRHKAAPIQPIAVSSAKVMNNIGFSPPYRITGYISIIEAIPMISKINAK
jgi:hypothetical protein